MPRTIEYEWDLRAAALDQHQCNHPFIFEPETKQAYPLSTAIDHRVSYVPLAFDPTLRVPMNSQILNDPESSEVDPNYKKTRQDVEARRDLSG